MKGARTMKKTTLHKMVFLGIAVLFAGCAVLTVDVDVYKGPLANHEDIQTEQMAAMAIGAKPLLVELRDTLEADYMRSVARDMQSEPEYEASEAEGNKDDLQVALYEIWRCKNLKTRLSKLRGLPWYRPEYVKPYLGESYFKDSSADNVNNILYLYKDSEPDRYVELRNTIDEILTQYKRVYAILRPQDMAEDKALAKEDFIRKMEKSDPNASKLLNAYKGYLGDNRRDALKVVQETLAYLKTAKLRSSPLRELSKEESDENAMKNVTNAAQRLLAETKLVDECADEIFGLKGRLRDQFVTRVKQIAKAYLESRTALEELWLATMNGIAYINSLPVVDDEERVYREKLTVRLADLSLDIIQPRYLAVLLDAAKQNRISEDINNFAISLGSYLSADPNKSNQEWDFEQMKYYLGKKLKKEPVETAEALKAIHKFCKSALDPGTASVKQYVGKRVLGSLAFKEGWRFGLVRAPFEAGTEELKLKKLETDAQKAFTHEGGAFAGGRLDKGLEKFIEEYLEQASVCNPNDYELRWARKRLSDALVRFAQKLLFVANNRSLISPPKDWGLVPGTFRMLSVGLIGEKFMGPVSDFIGLSQADTDPFTRILQAVGNSILVQADALHQEKIHANGLERRADTEIAVLRHTLGLSAEKVIDRLIQGLEAEQSSKQQQAKKTASALANAEKQLEELKKKVKTLSNETEPDKQAAAQAAKEMQDQQRYVDSLKKTVEDAQIESEKIAATIVEIRDVKVAVLEKIEEMDSYASAGTVYGLVHSTLQEKLENQGSAGARNEKIKSLKNAVEGMNDRPLPMDLKLSDSMLPKDPTAKDIRDVWITLLEYEHDLALRDGDKARAGQILEAITAARKKREDMIFIRPAMAYLRTSFPATSLQNNPNLTWDNMLAGHAMRSIPFGPQIGEFLNPDAKRDARITAEIDKQFWQNINRVRVAGGGFTNYAVVKDDIGNWYVKGYSANPNDVIKSAKNLAMFSLGAKMNTDLLAQINRKEGDLSGADDSDANRTGVEQLYEKYTDAYNARTQTDRDRLIDILKGGFKNDIEQAWHQNEGLEQLKDAISKLEEKRDAATKLHLNNALDELKKSTDDADHGTKIVGALRAIMWFHNTLLTSIHDLDLTAPAKAKLSLAEKNRAAQELNLRSARDKCSGLEKVKDKAEVDWNNKSQAAANDTENSEKKQTSKEAKDVLDIAKAELVSAEKKAEEEQAVLEVKTKAVETAYIEYEAAIRAEERAIRDVTRIVREELMRIITRRKEAVKDLETAIMFIGESNKQ